MSKDQLLEQSTIQYYETAVNEVLRTKLKLCLDKREACCTEIQEYQQLQSNITNLKNIDTNPFKTKVDLGCSFFVEAEVPDVSKVFVAVGFGFFLELTREEAISFIPKKVELLKERLKQLEDTSANIEADIKTMLGILADLQNLSVGTR